MKKLQSAVMLCTIMALSLLLFAGCASYDEWDISAIRERIRHLSSQGTRTAENDECSDVSDSGQTVRIGVTSPSHDNIGQILMFFGGGVEFTVICSADLANLERLNEFYAVFINCGSHGAIEPRVLRSYVRQGGIVYASDLASAPLISAFPKMFNRSGGNPSMTVHRAEVTHTGLASHMGVNSLDVIFNMGGWDAITRLSREATTYIQGYVPGHGVIPLAMSFDYGNGTVFFTSFHNNAQATSHMVNFVEYLVFRIKFIEADRGLADRTESEGFVYRGAVFGFFGGRDTLGSVMMRAADAAPGSFDMDMTIAEAAEALAAAPLPEAAFNIQRTFHYYFGEGDDFMLMIDAGGESFTLRLYDPVGNVFYLTQQGELISYSQDSEEPVSIPDFESIDGCGVLVPNALGGQWSFTIVADDAAGDAVFVVGIATRSQ